MPKLVQFSAAFNCGAPGIIVEQIGQLAKQAGWDVAVVHGCRHYFPSELKTLAMSSNFDEHIHALLSLGFDAHGMGSKAHTKRVVGLLHDYKPDIIHLHNLHGYYINYPVLFEYLKKVDIPVVWTFHDFWPITGHCVHFDYVGCKKWKSGCNNCEYHRNYPPSLIDKSPRNYQLKKELFNSIRNLNIVPVSNWVSSVLKESFLGNHPIRRIYNGVDTKVFRPRESSFFDSYRDVENTFFLLGVASPWSDMKGIKDYYSLRGILPLNYKIVLVGLTKKQIDELPEGIIGIQRINTQEEMAEVYSAADIVLNLSYQETFGLTTVEGMACGTPGIVYNRTASPELISSNVGLVVEAGNIEALAEAIIKMHNNGKSYYSEACRQRALNLFDKSNCYQQYIDLYTELLSHKS